MPPEKGLFIMKKITSALALSTLLLAGFAQAETNDVAATVAISGTVQTATPGCTVEFVEPTVDIGSRTISSLPFQGHDVNKAQLREVTANLVGNCTNEGDLTANVSFTGPVANAEGDALMNMATGSGAATGLGVGIYSLAGNVIIPDGRLIPGTGTDKTIFYVGMVKLNGATPTAGKVQSSLTMQVESL